MDLPPRWRRLLDDNFAVAVAVCLLVAAVGGFLLFDAYVGNESVEEERVVSSWEVVGGIDHGATVRESTAAFDVGERLSNRSEYFLRVAPVLDGNVSFAYAASQGGNLTVTVERTVRIESLRDAGGDGERTLVWSETLAERRVERHRVGPGEAVAVPYEVNVSRARGQVERIRGELGASPGEARLVVAANVTATGSVNGRAVQRSFAYALPVQFGGGLYSVEANGPVRESFERTETLVVEESPGGGLAGVAGSFLFLVGTTAAVGLVVGRARGEIRVDDAERARLEFETEREEYDEWVSAVELPAEAREFPEARAASLGDLVDVAIDAGGRVVEDPCDGTFYLLSERTLYVYEPPPSPDDDADEAVDATGSLVERVSSPGSLIEVVGLDGALDFDPSSGGGETSTDGVGDATSDPSDDPDKSASDVGPSFEWAGSGKESETGPSGDGSDASTDDAGTTEPHQSDDTSDRA